jgi:hypothetical protein
MLLVGEEVAMLVQEVLVVPALVEREARLLGLRHLLLIEVVVVAEVGIQPVRLVAEMVVMA